MLQNEYLVANIGADTAKDGLHFAKFNPFLGRDSIFERAGQTILFL